MEGNLEWPVLDREISPELSGKFSEGPSPTSLIKVQKTIPHVWRKWFFRYSEGPNGISLSHETNGTETPSQYLKVSGQRSVDYKTVLPKIGIEIEVKDTPSSVKSVPSSLFLVLFFHGVVVHVSVLSRSPILSHFLFLISSFCLRPISLGFSYSTVH